MSKVSKKIMNKDLEERMYEVFWDAISGIQSAEQAQKFLNSFISDVENTMLAKRFGIALMLAKDYKYQEIKDTLKVSSATIMSVSIRYKIGEGGLAPAIKRALRKEKVEDFLDNIDEWILMLSRPGRYGTYRHQKRVEEGHRLYKRGKKRAAL